MYAALANDILRPRAAEAVHGALKALPSIMG